MRRDGRVWEGMGCEYEYILQIWWFQNLGLEFEVVLFLICQLFLGPVSMATDLRCVLWDEGGFGV